MTTVAQTTNRTVALDDSQRTRCEVWTRVMGYHRPVLIQYRQARGIP